MVDVVIENVNDLLLEGNFKIISYISDDLKCALCKKILTNACLSSCGCKYCRKCIDQYMTDGGRYCPGMTKDCTLNNLTSFAVDHETNQLVLRLIVRCAEENCCFECELINMKKHFGICQKKVVHCPFNIEGFEKKISDNKMIENLKMEKCNHSRLFTETINNLRNEMKNIEKANEMNGFEISLLKDILKENKIELEMIKEIASALKMENIILKTELEKLKESKENSDKVNKTKKATFSEDISSADSNLNFIKTERNKMEHDPGEEFPTRTSMNGNDEMKLKNENTKSVMCGIRKAASEERRDHEMEIRMSLLEKYLNFRDGIFVWHIGVIDKLDKDRYVSTEYFYDRNNFYKFGLQLVQWTDSNRLYVRLLIYSGANDEYVEWPFDANVIINIADKFDGNKNEWITKHCIINQPVNNRCKCSELFIFKKSDLSNDEISSKDTDCIIECFIDYNK